MSANGRRAVASPSSRRGHAARRPPGDELAPWRPAAVQRPGRVRAVGRVRRARYGRRRLLALILIGSMAALLAAGLSAVVSLLTRGSGSPPGPPLTPLQARIVTLADAQLGYRTDPAHSYCNRFSAFFGAGATDCPSGLRDEEWCADFAAWVWRRAGVHFSYGLALGDLNAASASFVAWGVEHGTWHPVGSGYRPRPGDVAVYGYDPETLTAVHVAIVTGYQPGARGPDVVNGDGDRTAFRWSRRAPTSGRPICTTTEECSRATCRRRRLAGAGLPPAADLLELPALTCPPVDSPQQHHARDQSRSSPGRIQSASWLVRR